MKKYFKKSKNDSMNKQVAGGTKMFKKIKYLGMMGFLLMTGHVSAVYMGTDIDCDYHPNDTTIQELIDAGERYFRLTNQLEFNESLEVSGNIQIIGGYENCADIGNSVRGSNTVINAGGSGPVLSITSPNDGSDTSVSLKGLTITGGVNQGFHYGGGVSVYDSSDNFIQVNIEDALISDNTGIRGGGIYLKGERVRAHLLSTIILNNQAIGAAGGTALGGGVYCSEGEFSLSHNSGINGNQAFSQIQNAGMGGGLYATNGCEVSLYSGTQGGIFDFRGVSFNSASAHGGGIYVNNGAYVSADSSFYGQPININGNFADSSHTGFGDGGGIYVTGDGSSFHGKGVKLSANDAINGGGAAAYSDALLFINNNGSCWDNSQCNEVSQNTSKTDDGLGGALYLNQATALIEYARVFGNVASAGSVVYGGNNANTVLKRSMLYDNGNSAQWDVESTYHLDSSHITMSHITSVNNQAEAATIRQINGNHQINNSIFQETITNQFGNLINSNGTKDCLVVDNNYGIGGQATNVIIGDANLTEELQLQSESVAIDRCFNIINEPTNQELDINGEMAPYDHPNYANGGALIDIGADEYVPYDFIFTDSFEGEEI